jgi:hypothetical protein
VLSVYALLAEKALVVPACSVPPLTLIVVVPE